MIAFAPLRRAAYASLVLCGVALAQDPEYAFYPEYRNSVVPRARDQDPSASGEQIIDRYLAKLRAAGVTDAEIARRGKLLRTDRARLENDYWNRFYLSGNSNFNRAPNAFLVKAVQGMRPGAALDYAMGEGRNSIYLAGLGWRVSGFDAADAAVGIARKRAKELGLTLDAQAASDSDYQFGKDRFDLILFSWSMPLIPVEKVLESLKPGGTVVMECAADYVGRNGMLKMFDALEIVEYEIVRAKADFYDQLETDVLRMVAVKPK